MDIKVSRGDIILYRRRLDSALVAHRMIKQYETRTGKAYILKGDASPFVDNVFVTEKDIVGGVVEIQRQNGRSINASNIRFIIIKKATSNYTGI